MLRGHGGVRNYFFHPIGGRSAYSNAMLIIRLRARPAILEMPFPCLHCMPVTAAASGPLLRKKVKLIRILILKCTGSIRQTPSASALTNIPSVHISGFLVMINTQRVFLIQTLRALRAVFFFRCKEKRRSLRSVRI